jgi:hypothetical protein
VDPIDRQLFFSSTWMHVGNGISTHSGKPDGFLGLLRRILPLTCLNLLDSSVYQLPRNCITTTGSEISVISVLVCSWRNLLSSSWPCQRFNLGSKKTQLSGNGRQTKSFKWQLHMNANSSGTQCHFQLQIYGLLTLSIKATFLHGLFYMIECSQQTI